MASVTIRDPARSGEDLPDLGQYLGFFGLGQDGDMADRRHPLRHAVGGDVLMVAEFGGFEFAEAGHRTERGVPPKATLRHTRL